VTDEAGRALYGSTHVYSGQLDARPHAIVLLGRAPFLEAGEAVLRALAAMACAGASARALGAAVAHVLCDIPLPPRGRKTVQFMIGTAAIDIARPALNEPPCNAEDRGFRTLFGALSVENIVTVRRPAAVAADAGFCCCARQQGALMNPL
jgi:hypothetical protein